MRFGINGCIFLLLDYGFKKPQSERGKMKSTEKQLRTLHFVDIENLSETTILDRELVKRVKNEYVDLVQPGKDDLFVVGVSHFNLAAAVFGWGAGVAQYVVQSGENGADLALLQQINSAEILSRFSSLKIASGDGIFAEMATELRAGGTKVSFVGRHYSISHWIYRTGCECLVLPSTKEYELAC